MSKCTCKCFKYEHKGKKQDVYISICRQHNYKLSHVKYVPSTQKCPCAWLHYVHILNEHKAHPEGMTYKSATVEIAKRMNGKPRQRMKKTGPNRWSAWDYKPIDYNVYFSNMPVIKKIQKSDCPDIENELEKFKVIEAQEFGEIYEPIYFIKR